MLKEPKTAKEGYANPLQFSSIAMLQEQGQLKKGISTPYSLAAEQSLKNKGTKKGTLTPYSLVA